MSRLVRSTVVALLTLVAAVLLALSTTMTSVVLAATALIMGGTGHPLSVGQDGSAFTKSYANGANDSFISNSGFCGATPCTLVAVYTPEQFRIDTGLTDMTFDKSVAVGKANLDKCISTGSCIATANPYTSTNLNQNVADTKYVVYGYSQSATVATLEKRDLANSQTPPPPGAVSFILVANPNKPNGGILERFAGLYIPIVGVTFSGATPTDTDMTTVDVARQYDLISDFPTNPLNLLADVNALLGFVYLHGTYTGLGAPELQGRYGDTTYYLYLTQVLPVLMPLEQVPVIGHPLTVTLDPVFRVLVEAGYDRTINPAQPTPAKLLYFPNPIKTAVNLVVAVPTGLDNGISSFTGNRPLGTDVPGPYGVGGPDVNTGCGTSSCLGPTPAPTMTSFTADPQDSPPLDPKPNSNGQTPADTLKTDDTPKTDDTSKMKPNPRVLPFKIKPPKPLSSPDTNDPPTNVRKPAAPKFPVLKAATSLAGAFNDSSKTKPPRGGDESPKVDSTSTPPGGGTK